MIVIKVNILLILYLFCVFSQEIAPEPKTATLHENKARALRFYSKPSEEHPKETGVGLRRHLENALKGGSVGIDFEVNPLKKLKYFFQNRFQKLNFDWTSLIHPKKKQFDTEIAARQPENESERYWEYVKEKQNEHKGSVNEKRFEP